MCAGEASFDDMGEVGESEEMGDGECRGEREEGVSGEDDKAACSISLLTALSKSSFSGRGIVSRNGVFNWLGMGVSCLCFPKDFLSVREPLLAAASLLYCH